MTNNENDTQKSEEFGPGTRALAHFCHGCGICPFAARHPGSAFERLMRWHRGWCPAWAAHTKVYGEKDLTPRAATPESGTDG